MTNKAKPSQPRGDELFSGSRTVFGLVTVIGALIAIPTLLVLLEYGESSPKFLLIGVGIIVAYILIVIGLYNPKKNRWALRIICALIFLALFVALIVTIIGFATGKVSPLDEGNIGGLIQLSGAFLVAGIPCLIYALSRGKGKNVPSNLRWNKSNDMKATEPENRNDSTLSYSGGVRYEDYSKFFDIIERRGIPTVSKTAKIAISALILLIVLVSFFSLSIVRAAILSGVSIVFAIVALFAMVTKNKKKTEKAYEKEIESVSDTQYGEINKQYVEILQGDNKLPVPWDNFEGYIETENAIALVTGRAFFGFSPSMFKEAADWLKCLELIKTKQKELLINNSNLLGDQ